MLIKCFICPELFHKDGVVLQGQRQLLLRHQKEDKRSYQMKKICCGDIGCLKPHSTFQLIKENEFTTLRQHLLASLVLRKDST